MRYILVSGVAVKWVLAEPDSPKAIQLLDEYNRQMHELLAPDVFPVEIAHALSRAVRRGLIQPIEGSQHLSDLLIPTAQTERDGARMKNRPRPGFSPLDGRPYVRHTRRAGYEQRSRAEIPLGQRWSEGRSLAGLELEAVLDLCRDRSPHDPSTSIQHTPTVLG
jgi:hypothetical protein